MQPFIKYINSNDGSFFYELEETDAFCYPDPQCGIPNHERVCVTDIQFDFENGHHTYKWLPAKATLMTYDDAIRSLLDKGSPDMFNKNILHFTLNSADFFGDFVCAVWRPADESRTEIEALNMPAEVFQAFINSPHHRGYREINEIINRIRTASFSDPDFVQTFQFRNVLLYALMRGFLPSFNRRTPEERIAQLIICNVKKTLENKTAAPTLLTQAKLCRVSYYQGWNFWALINHNPDMPENTADIVPIADGIMPIPGLVCLNYLPSFKDGILNNDQRMVFYECPNLDGYPFHNLAQFIINKCGAEAAALHIPY